MLAYDDNNEKRYKEYEKSVVNLKWKKLCMYHDIKKESEWLLSRYNQLEDELYDVGGVKAVQYDKESFGNGDNKIESVYIKIIAEQEYIKAELKKVMTTINEIESIRDNCISDEVKEIITYKFFDNNTWENTENKFFRSRRSMELAIRKEIRNGINKKGIH